MKFVGKRINLFQILFFSTFALFFWYCSSPRKNTGETEQIKPRVIVSSDIGGTDPDDFQSMIHYLMYADRFETEGLIASPHGLGRKEHILKILDLYEKDYPNLKRHADFPSPEELRAVVKQGQIDMDTPKGWDESTEGSEWIIKQAKKDSEQPLWILVWGGLGDVAQALHDAPEIEKKIKVYWIGGPNKKWSIPSYLYVAQNFPDLWMIEANSTYRGWIIDSEASSTMKNDNFYQAQIKGKGALGSDFGNYYEGKIKMGDTPSVAYLLNGDANNPEGESWGGSFTKLPFSAIRKYQRQTTEADTIPTYSVIEWTFNTGNSNVDAGEHEIWMEIDKQRIDGFYAGNGIYKVWFVPKRIGNWRYVINCSSEYINGKTGEFTSANPWPGKEHPNNLLLNNWWSDRLSTDLFISEYQGAKTVSKWREEFLSNWAVRLNWLIE